MASRSVHDYLIEPGSLDWSRLLADWAWMLPPKLTAWMMNRFGDLFLVLLDGTVHVLDVGGGRLTKLADSRDDFCNKIDEDGNADEWLMIPLVDKAVAAGLLLQPGQCYSYKMPPVLGGQYAIENVCVLSIAEHLGVHASIHEQLRDVPDGVQVEVVIGPRPARGRRKRR